jgi:hypothetical protein
MHFTFRNAIIVVISLLMAAIQNPDCLQYLAHKKGRSQMVRLG